MKNQNVKKINTIGKVGRIIISIAIVFLIIGFVSCIILGIGSLVFSTSASEMVKINGSGAASVEIGNLPFGISPDKVIKVDDFNFDMFGISMRLDDNENVSDGSMLIESQIGIDDLKFEAGSLFIAFGGVCFIGALIIAAFTAAMFFARKLARTLEKCDSPFEADVIKAMKHFGISLIPWAVINCLSGVSVVMSILFVLIVLLFVYIFSYGAQLQQESDDTV